MRNAALLFCLMLCTTLSALAQGEIVADTLKPERFVMRSTLYGLGYTNILDTYLSPTEYTGMEFRVLHERMRMTRMLHGNVSLQSMLQANVAYTRNHADTGNEISALVNWNYGLHYQFRINENLKILAGGLGDLNLGFIYNTRNSNNPAQAKAYLNLAASGMAIYKFRVKNSRLTARYQLNVPLIGVMFSPEYGESYYEIFTLGNHSGIINFTSLHNEPALRQLLTLDIPTGNTTLRVGYICDIQQSKVNCIRSHTYSHTFMIGVVKNFYRIKRKDRLSEHSPF